MLETSPRRVAALRPVMAVLIAALVLALAPEPAAAQSAKQRKQRASQLYREGRTSYDLGRWDKAIEQWQEAYEMWPAPRLLFNIGQSYRQKGDCESALFFYKRYLTRDPDAPNRDEVEGFIGDLEENCERTRKVKEKPPLGAMPPDKADEEDDDTTSSEPTEPVAAPTRSGTPAGSAASPSDGVAGRVAAGAPSKPILSTIAEVGPTFLAAGDLQAGTLLSVRAGAGYPIAVGPVTVEPGGAVTLTPVPWSSNASSGTSLLTGLLANGAVRYPILDKLDVRGEVGVGALVLSGVSDADNVFIADMSRATGALAMFHLRAGIGVEYEVLRGLVVSVSPMSISYSPAKEGMREDIDSIVRFDVLAGLSYRL